MGCAFPRADASRFVRQKSAPGKKNKKRSFRIRRKLNKTEHSVELLIDNYGSVDVYRYKTKRFIGMRGVVSRGGRGAEREERRINRYIPVEKLVESLTRIHGSDSTHKGGSQPPSRPGGGRRCVLSWRLKKKNSI